MNLSQEIIAIMTSIYSGAQYGLKVRFPHALLMTFLFRNDLSLKKKIQTIVTLTWHHSYSLAKFAGIYKLTSILIPLSATSETILFALKCTSNLRLNGMCRNSFNSELCTNECILPGYPKHKCHPFIAGAIGGYFVWGKEYSSVHYQILLYLVSRVLVGCLKVTLINQQNQRVPIAQIAPRDGRILFNRSLFSKALNCLKRAFQEKGYSLSSTVVWALVMSLFENSSHSLHPSLRSSMEEIYHSSPTNLLSYFSRVELIE